VTPEADRTTVGDTVTLAFRVRLDERDLLFDTIPKPARTLPDWIRSSGSRGCSGSRTGSMSAGRGSRSTGRDGRRCRCSRSHSCGR